MKKAKVKEKTSKKSAKSSPLEQQGLLDLVSAMAKIAERLEGLEKKMEQVIRQTSAGLHGQNVQRFEHSHDGHDHRHESQSLNQNQVPQHNNNRHERPMYKAVCADCRKDCEVPFKPTGERPVYCKECFAKRKASSLGAKTTVGVPLHQQNPMTRGASKPTILRAGSASPRRSLLNITPLMREHSFMATGILSPLDPVSQVTPKLLQAASLQKNRKNRIRINIHLDNTYDITYDTKQRIFYDNDHRDSGQNKILSFIGRGRPNARSHSDQRETIKCCPYR
jgi:CxxC-x17-CxxC domain-containing protein